MKLKTPERAIKEATAEAWGRKIKEEGAPPFLLVFVQDGTVSCMSTLETPTLINVLGTLQSQFDRAMAAMARTPENEDFARRMRETKS